MNDIVTTAAITNLTGKTFLLRRAGKLAYGTVKVTTLRRVVVYFTDGDRSVFSPAEFFDTADTSGVN